MTGMVAGLLAGAAMLMGALAVWAARSSPLASLAGPATAGHTGPEPVDPAKDRRVVGPTLPRGRRAKRRRWTAVEREVPPLLDLLAAGSSAGLSAELALRRATEALGGPLGTDLRLVFGRADLGARWREELDDYVRASGSVDLRRTVAVLSRTEKLGSSLVDATRELATAVRQARRASVLERARTAPVKMLFPLVFLILPAFLLLTVVPVLLTTLRAIS